MSEIDDIFSKRPPAKKKSNATASSSEASTSAVQKKKSKSEAKAPSPLPSKKRPAPETILDPSSRPPPQKKTKVDKPPVNDKKDTENFKDSRGTGPRRKTEEGWSIYKEDELGIGDEGGDTPLCPFDCDCCF